MHLYRVLVTHYSQKDSHTATEAFLLAEDEEAVYGWVAGTACWDEASWASDGDRCSVSPSRSWWAEHPAEADRARSMGLDVRLCDWGDRAGEPDEVEGPTGTLIRWWRGDPREVSDLYYGATRYRWEVGPEVPPAEAEALVRLGVAKSLVEDRSFRSAVERLGRDARFPPGVLRDLEHVLAAAAGDDELAARAGRLVALWRDVSERAGAEERAGLRLAATLLEVTIASRAT